MEGPGAQEEELVQEDQVVEEDPLVVVRPDQEEALVVVNSLLRSLLETRRVTWHKHLRG